MFMSGCTVFVFLSLMEYALVNIVMGDIADIEKKKNSGLSHLLLGVRGPAMGATGGVKTQKSFHAMQDMGGMGAMGMSTHDPIDTKDHEVRESHVYAERISLVDETMSSPASDWLVEEAGERVRDCTFLKHSLCLRSRR